MKKVILIMVLILALCCAFVSCNDEQISGNKTGDKIECKIEHYQENIDGTFGLKETEKLSVNLNDEVTDSVYSLKNYEGFVFDSENKNNIKSGKAIESGLTLKLYYKRKEFTVIFTDGESEMCSPQTVKYGGTIQRPSAQPKKIDYVFTDWYKDGQVYNFASAVKGDIELVAKFEREWTHVYKPSV